MLRAVAIGVVISCLLMSFSVAENGFSRCNCDDEGSLWSIYTILETQKVSDFLIAIAYFSIPLELIYFVSCSNVPFKWVLFEFIAFIVLCGLTHLLNGWTYGPHPFQLTVALTVFKILTALVSGATAITLITLIPLLLKVKVREFMLKKKAWDLGREVGIIMKQKETGVHVRMLTREIRKSLDRHMILDTTLVELSKTLGLQNCAVWMPNEIKTRMNLTHDMKPRQDYDAGGYNYNNSIPIEDPDVMKIKRSEEVNILRPNSVLARRTTGEHNEAGPTVAIRVPMLRVCNFKGGTPEVIQTCYAILVCVLPCGQEQPRHWTYQELEIVKVVADQVAVALSHAAILEESQLLREKLVDQNRVLQLARQNALRASQARGKFEKMMSDGMRRPMHSVLGLLSLMQEEKLNNDQQLIIDTMVKASDVLSVLINDAMDISRKDSGRLSPVQTRCFSLRAMVREAACLAKCLSICKGFGFLIEVEKSLPDYVIGDERRVFQVIFHMVGNLLDGKSGGGNVIFRVVSERGSSEGNDQRRAAWRQNYLDEYVNIRFELGIGNTSSEPEGSVAQLQLDRKICSGDGAKEHLSFSICKKLVELMQGNIWVIPNPQGFVQSMSLVLRFQIRSSISIAIPDYSPEHSSEHSKHRNLHFDSLFRGMRILLADDDELNRAVTRKLLENLGCIVTVVSSGFECVSAVGPSSPFQAVLLELNMQDLDGYEVSARIRKSKSRNWPLIIAVTASTDEDLWDKCLQVGINGVVRKPVLLTGIATELRRVILEVRKVTPTADSLGSSTASIKV